MDIGSGKSYPAHALSNFAPHPFVFDGVECASLETLCLRCGVTALKPKP